LGAAQHPLEPTAPSALVVLRPLGFVGMLVQDGGRANPALRLSFSVENCEDTLKGNGFIAN